MKKPPWELTREMFLSEQEVDSLLSNLQQCVKSARNENRNQALTDELIVHCLIFSGLRNSEFCRLRVTDTILGHAESVFKVENTPRQDRTVHVPDFVSELVSHYVNTIRPNVIPNDSAPYDESLPLVFNERGRPYERTGLYRRVVRILTAAGFAERAILQLLRHTYGYLAYKRSGGNLLFLQQQLGHAHPMVTSVYANFVDEDYSRLANLTGGQL